MISFWSCNVYISLDFSWIFFLINVPKCVCIVLYGQIYSYIYIWIYSMHGYILADLSEMWWFWMRQVTKYSNFWSTFIHAWSDCLVMDAGLHRLSFVYYLYIYSFPFQLLRSTISTRLARHYTAPSDWVNAYCHHML